jgi:hypothetical protein
VTVLPAKSIPGQPVAITATVGAVAPGAGTPGGTVIFKDGAAILGSLPLDGSGQAVLTTSNLSAGHHSITAAYGGNANFNAADSAPFNLTVGDGLDRSALLLGPRE